MESDPPSQSPTAAPTPASPRRRAYVAPALIEFGSVAKLTQGMNTTTNPDGASGMAMT